MKSISAKKLKALGGKLPWSSITSPRKTPKRSTKKIRAVNPERLAKRRKRYTAALRRYRASETYKIVQQRAAGRCEASLRFARQGQSLVLVEIRDGLEWVANGEYVRCTETDDLEHHHRTYARAGGDELPSDMCVSGPRCHGWIERVNHPTRRNGR